MAAIKEQTKLPKLAMTDLQTDPNQLRLNRNFLLLQGQIDQLFSLIGTGTAATSTTPTPTPPPSGNTNDILVDKLLTGPTTITSPQTPNNGQILTVILRQDGFGGRTISWGSGFVGTVRDIDTTPNTFSTFQFVGSGGQWVMCCTPLTGATTSDNTATGNTQVLLPSLLVDRQISGSVFNVVSPAPVQNGQHLTLVFRQDVTGGTALAWGLDFVGGPTDIDTTAGTATLVEFVGANSLWVCVGLPSTGIALSSPVGTGTLLSSSAANLLLNQTLAAPSTNIVSPSVPGDAQRLSVILKQDATGGRLITWDTPFDGVDTDIDTSPGTVTAFRLVGEGLAWILKTAIPVTGL